MKIKSLAEEARIIRREESRYKGPIWGPTETRNSLHNHRTYDVRNEARASLLAYGFLRGKTLTQIEKSTYTQTFGDYTYKCGLGAIALRRAGKIAEKFSKEPNDIIKKRFEEWVNTGVAERRSARGPKGSLETLVQIQPPVPVLEVC